jgi:hypothetical protein
LLSSREKLRKHRRRRKRSLRSKLANPLRSPMLLLKKKTPRRKPRFSHQILFSKQMTHLPLLVMVKKNLQVMTMI